MYAMLPEDEWLIKLLELNILEKNSISVYSFAFVFLLKDSRFRWRQIFNKPLIILMFKWHIKSFQFSSVTQLCPTHCDPMNRSMLGLPVHHQLPEFTQSHVHRVSDAIQPSHPLSSPSPPAPNPSSIRVFSNESTLCMRWPKYWSFSFNISPSNEYPGL